MARLAHQVGAASGASSSAEAAEVASLQRQNASPSSLGATQLQEAMIKIQDLEYRFFRSMTDDAKLFMFQSQFCTRLKVFVQQRSFF